jgi:hypothetical protein
MYRSDHPTARVFDTTTGKRLLEVSLPGNQECGTTAMGLSADGRRLAVTSWVAGGQPIQLQVWDVENRRAISPFVDRGFTQWANALVFNPDGRTVVTGGRDGILRVWEVASGGVRQKFQHEGYITSVAFTPDGRTLAASSLDAPVYLWDIDGDRTHALDKATRLASDAAWAALAEVDAKAGFTGVRALVAGGDTSVRLIRGQLKPTPRPNQVQVRQWLADLGSPKFEVREQAGAELTRAADTVRPALKEAAEKAASAEVRNRAEKILAESDLPNSTTLRTVRAVEVLERIGTAEAKRLLAELAGGVESARLTNEARSAALRLK